MWECDLRAGLKLFSFILQPFWCPCRKSLDDVAAKLELRRSFESFDGSHMACFVFPKWQPDLTVYSEFHLQFFIKYIEDDLPGENSESGGDHAKTG